MLDTSKLKINTFGLLGEEDHFEEGFELVESDLIQNPKLSILTFKIIVVDANFCPESIGLLCHILIFLCNLRSNRILLHLEIFLCHFRYLFSSVHDELINSVNQIFTTLLSRLDEEPDAIDVSLDRVSRSNYVSKLLLGSEIIKEWLLKILRDYL